MQDFTEELGPRQLGVRTTLREKGPYTMSMEQCSMTGIFLFSAKLFGSGTLQTIRIRFGVNLP